MGSESALAPNANSAELVISVGLAAGFDLDSPKEKLSPRDADSGVSFSLDDPWPKLNADEPDPKAIPELAATGFVGDLSVTCLSLSSDEDCPKLNAEDPDPNAAPEFAATVLFGTSDSVGFPNEKAPAPGATAATGDFVPNIGAEDSGVVVDGDPNDPNKFAGGPDFSAGFSGSGLFEV